MVAVTDGDRFEMTEGMTVKIANERSGKTNIEITEVICNGNMKINVVNIDQADYFFKSIM